MNLTAKWILAGIIVGALFAILGVLKLLEYRTLRRIRTLCCPDCGAGFIVPGYAAIKRWMEFDTEPVKRRASGFYLRCPRCNADFRYADDFTSLGRVAKAEDAAQ